MASQRKSTPKTRTETVNRTLRVRLYPGTPANGRYLEQLAGACRFAWNAVLAGHQQDYRCWREHGRQGQGPGSPTFFTLGKRFTQVRNAPGNEWLQAYSFKVVRYACKYMADAYAAFFDPNRPDHGMPRFKAKYFTTPGFTIPSDVRLEDGRLYIPKLGWLRLAPLRRYAGCKPLMVRCKQESETKQPQWYAYIVFEVPVDHPDVVPPAVEGAVGVDRNVGQATDSTGRRHTVTDDPREMAKIKRYQRRMARQQKGSNRRRGTANKLRKLHRKRARRRDSETHRVSRKIADTGHTVVLEDLDTKAMTQSAKGTVEEPGRHVQAEIRVEPRHPGIRLGADGAETGVQGRTRGVRGPRLHVADLQPVRPCRQVQPTVAGGVPVRGLRVPGKRRPQRGDQHSGTGGTSARARPGPRDRGFCTARGAPSLPRRTPWQRDSCDP